MTVHHSRQTTVRRPCILRTAEPALGGKRARPLTRLRPPVSSAWPLVPPPAATEFTINLHPSWVRDLRGVKESHHVGRDLLQVLVGRLQGVGVHVQYDHVLQSSTPHSLPHTNTERERRRVSVCVTKCRCERKPWDEGSVVPLPGWSEFQWGTASVR